MADTNSGQMISVTDCTVDGNLTNIINPPQVPQNRSPVSHGIPLNPDEIVGREEDADNLKRLITSNDHKPVAITGFAALGKTSLAIHCARQWSDPGTGFITDVALLDADTTESFDNSIRGFAARLRLQVKEMNTVDIISEICDYYNKDRQVLIIYDNLDDYEVFNEYRFPNDLSNVYILATSQLTEIRSAFQCHPLSNLTRGSSEQLIKSMLSEYFSEISEENVISFLDMFEGHAFSIVQACAYIRDTREYGDEKNINRIIKEFTTNYERYMQVKLPVDFPNNYNKVPYTVLKLNIEKLGDSASKHVLCLLSYMDPNDIYAGTISQFEDCLIKFNLINSSDKNVLRDLKKYSLVTEFEAWSNKRLNVHRLVQAVCRMLVRDSDVNLEPQYIAILMLSLQKKDREYTHYSYCFDHVQLQSLEEASKMYIQYQQNNQIIHKYISPQEDLNTWTILHVSSLIEHHIEILIRKFPKLKNLIDNQTNTGLSALHIAVLRYNCNNIRYLVDNGCDINIQDQHGNTVAHLAPIFYYNYMKLPYIYHHDKFNKMITNNAGLSVTDCTELEVSGTNIHELSTGEVIRVYFTPRYCKFSVKSLFKEILQEHPVYWHYAVNSEDLVRVTIDKLQSRAWWSDSEAEATRQVISLLGNACDYPRLESYVAMTDIRVSAVLDRLKDDTDHSELEIFISQSAAPEYKYFYKLVTMVIDRVMEVDPDSFTMLGCIALSRNSMFTTDYLVQLLKQERVKVEQCIRVLVDYDLVWDCINRFGKDIMVSAVIHVYVSERGLTRDIVSMLLDDPNCTDKQINDYLKNTNFKF